MRSPLKGGIAIGRLLTIIAIIVAITAIVLNLPTVEEKLSRGHSDTYVYVYGMEHSYNIDELREQDSIRYTVIIDPIQVPEGLFSVGDELVTRWFFDWHIQMMRNYTS